MTIEEYMSVCPEWAEQHREAWEELIRARWLRQDEEFAAVSRRNMENRGTGGTHCAGNRDYTRFKGKKVAEAPPGVVLHDAQIYDMMRTKQKPNPALPQPQYYGNAKAAKEDYCDMVKSRHPEVDDPLSIPVDEESLVLSGHGRPHGRFPWMNKAVKPTHSTSYTRLKHTLTADSPQPRPRPARPPAYDPDFEAAFEACNEAYQQAVAQWNRQNTAYMTYLSEMMISMSTGTPPPDRVTVAGDMPIMPSRAAFAATYYGSTPEGTGWSGNQASPGGREVTPVHEGGRSPGRSAGVSPSTTPGTTPGASPSTSPGRATGPSPGGSSAASTGAKPRAARFAKDVGGHTPPGSFLR
ncbi:uncharacterized protein [Lolium perenne]|uniref:uncharacterized protein n=1 Tax=Lolium perenne TaxID=4522 RepID=UPI003A9998F3